MLSLKSHAFLCEKSLDQINGLYVATDPTTIIQSNDLELVLLPARSYTEDCAPTAFESSIYDAWDVRLNADPLAFAHATSSKPAFRSRS